MLATVPFTNAHRQLVVSLYRQACKTARFWNTTPEDVAREHMAIRRRFDIYKNTSDPAEVERLVASTKALLKKYQHPDPIIPPTRPGGTKFDRYLPPLYGAVFPVSGI